jgi:hypothetical protein
MAKIAPHEVVDAIRQLSLTLGALVKFVRNLPSTVVATFSTELSAAVFGDHVTVALDALIVLHNTPVAIPYAEVRRDVFARNVANMVYGTPVRVLSILYRCVPEFAMDVLRIMCLPPVDVLMVGAVGRVLVGIMEENNSVCPKLSPEINGAMIACLVRHWYMPGQQVTYMGQVVTVTKDYGNGMYDTSVRSGVFFLKLQPLRSRLKNLGDRKRFVLQAWTELVRRGGRPPLELTPILRHFVSHEEAFTVVRSDVVALYEAMAAKSLVTAADLVRVLRREEVALIAMDMPRRSAGPDMFDDAVALLYHPYESLNISAGRPHHHCMIRPWLLTTIVNARHAVDLPIMPLPIHFNVMWRNLAYVVKTLSQTKPLTVPHLLKILSLVLLARDGKTTISKAEQPFFTHLALTILRQTGSAMGGKRMLVTFYRRFPHLLTDAVLERMLPYLLAVRIGMTELMIAVLSLPTESLVDAVLGVSLHAGPLDVSRGVKRSRSGESALSSLGVKRLRSDVSKMRADIAEHICPDVGRELADMLGVPV